MREIEVVPDEVVLSLSVITEDEKNPLLAKSENDKRTQDILKAAKSHHVDDKYIKTDCLQIQPEYVPNSRQLIGYSVTRGINITLQQGVTDFYAVIARRAILIWTGVVADM